MYQRGLGVAQNFQKALSWFEKAAAQNLPEANVNLGLLYFDGLGVTQDQQKAFRLFSIAARDKLPEAHHMLGLQLYQGIGVPSDFQTALQHFRDAAVLGYPESQYMLAFLYQSGDLGEVRADLAYVWSKITVITTISKSLPISIISRRYYSMTMSRQASVKGRCMLF